MPNMSPLLVEPSRAIDNALQQFILRQPHLNGGNMIDRHANPLHALGISSEVSHMHPIDFLFSHQSSSSSLGSLEADQNASYNVLSQLAAMSGQRREEPEWRQRLRNQMYPPNRNNLVIPGRSSSESPNSNNRPARSAETVPSFRDVVENFPAQNLEGFMTPISPLDMFYRNAEINRYSPRMDSRDRTSELQQQHNSHMSAHFKTKAVCELECKSCLNNVCNRGMKAILLANAKVELYSTDAPPPGVQLVGEDYTTSSCRCKVRDVACLGCGNVVGYHVTHPCERCLDACNNGHFWMFHADTVGSRERRSSIGNIMLWANLPGPEKDKKLADDTYDKICR